MERKELDAQEVEQVVGGAFVLFKGNQHKPYLFDTETKKSYTVLKFGQCSDYLQEYRENPDLRSTEDRISYLLEHKIIKDDWNKLT